MNELIDNCLAKNQKKTILILNENNFSNEDCIQIIRLFLNKLKKILKLSKELEKNNNLEKTISEAKPPIFWKDKEIVKQQLKTLSLTEIKYLIHKVNNLELEIKKNNQISDQILNNFILENLKSTNSAI